MEEIWKPVKSLEDYYEVSNLGRVRSRDRVTVTKNRWGKDSERRYKGKIMKQYMSRDYMHVDLCVDGKYYKKKVHRMMAEAFIPGGSDELEVNHINEVRSDNRLENLEWVTHRQNAIHGTAIERGKKHRPILGEKPVRQLTMSGQPVAEYPSTRAAARAVGSHDGSSISKACNGRIKHHKGYRWEWAEKA